MDLIGGARNLADTLKDKAQEVGNSVNEAVEAARNTATEIAASGTAKALDIQELSSAGLQHSFEAIQNTSNAFGDIQACYLRCSVWNSDRRCS